MIEKKEIVEITESGDDIPSPDVLNNEAHYLKASINEKNNDIYLSFSSKLAMYDFARSLLHESLFGVGGSIELYYLEFKGKNLVCDGVRLSNESPRIFIEYPDADVLKKDN